jgi:hypothetical protein
MAVLKIALSRRYAERAAPGVLAAMSAYQDRTWSGVILASSRSPKTGFSLFSMSKAYCSWVRGRMSVRWASHSSA